MCANDVSEVINLPVILMEQYDCVPEDLVLNFHFYDHVDNYFNISLGIDIEFQIVLIV